MKVLLVHNSYQHQGGEDSVVEVEAALLEEHGHELQRYTADNAMIAGLAAKVRAATLLRDNPAAGEAVVGQARAMNADVVHVHNFFPLLTPGVHRRLYAAGFPVVQTLHNYRLLCANGMFLRNDAVCERCVTNGRINAVLHRCYRGSVIGSAAVLAMQNAALKNRHWIASIARFIVLTEFQKQKMIEGGLPADKLVVKGNSIPDPGQGARPEERRGALFVGRIAPGKGVSSLVEAWRALPEVPLTIVGDGPELELHRRDAPSNVEFAGRKPREEVLAMMKRARFLVLPSTCYEGFPVTLVEAFSTGLPVIASALGGIPELVEPGRQGFLAPPGDPESLRQTVRQAFGVAGSGYAALSASARAQYLERYSAQANLEQLVGIYRSAVERAGPAISSPLACAPTPRI